MTTPKTTTHKSLLPSHEFYLAAGTVTLDRRARKCLVLFDRHTNQHGLPRGRADWGESLREAAIRETFEEGGGVVCRLLPVPVPTRATPPPGRSFVVPAAADEDGIQDPLGEVTRGVMLTEPFALLTHFRSNGALAVVHWFVAEADSSESERRGNNRSNTTQMADEDYEPKWVGWEDAVRLMPDTNHADLVRRACRLVERGERMEKMVATDGATAGETMAGETTSMMGEKCGSVGTGTGSGSGSGTRSGMTSPAPSIRSRTGVRVGGS